MSSASRTSVALSIFVSELSKVKVNNVISKLQILAYIVTIFYNEKNCLTSPIDLPCAPGGLFFRNEAAIVSSEAASLYENKTPRVYFLIGD